GVCSKKTKNSHQPYGCAEFSADISIGFLEMVFHGVFRDCQFVGNFSRSLTLFPTHLENDPTLGGKGLYRSVYTLLQLTCNHFEFRRWMGRIIYYITLCTQPLPVPFQPPVKHLVAHSNSEVRG